jgi:hypothetical protein
MDQYKDARSQLKSWIKSGELNPINDVVDGLEQAPEAFVNLLAGGNVGTRMVKIAV